MTRGGTYTLLVALTEPATVGFGARGDRDLAAGWYAYTGSALGPGGFARVERHRELAAGERDVRHWHVDYLLGNPDARLVRAATAAGLDAECRVARAVRAADGVRAVPGVGATDCGCDSHLAAAADRETLEAAVEAAREAAGH